MLTLYLIRDIYGTVLAAWKMALTTESISPSKRIKAADDQLIEYAKQESYQ
jgi:hypothetical protein